MRLNILIGGKAGQGINKVSEIVSRVLSECGYFTFNYRDYPSLIRGGHNFNVLCVGDSRVGSVDSVLDVILALDENTLKVHEGELVPKGVPSREGKREEVVISFEKFAKDDLGRNLNIALAGCLCSVLGIEKDVLIRVIKEELDFPETIAAAEKGFSFCEKKFDLKKLNNKIKIKSGSVAVAEGAVDSGINLYVAYPMTPATGVMNNLAGFQNDNLKVFQAENEIAVVNIGLGASFAGKRVMVGSSGGGFDLMSEGLSLQGISEIPLVVYLAARPGPGTGVPTYTTQGDLDIALRAGHGEFPRVVVAPGDPVECVEKTNEAFYLAEKFKTLAIVLSDKHLAESEFSFDNSAHKVLKVEIKRDVPGKKIVKASSYEHDEFGNTVEDAEITRKNAEARLKKYEDIKKECKNFEMVKIFGNKNSKNLVIGWGSTKGAILDAISGIDCKFLQVLYMKPLSDEIKKEIEKVEKVVLVENNVTGQLGRLIREKTGIKIENRILKYDGRPFWGDELRDRLEGVLG